MMTSKVTSLMTCLQKIFCRFFLACLELIKTVILMEFVKGGYQAFFFGNINFEIEVAQQGPYMYQHFGEVSGPLRSTGSEPRPAPP